VPDPKNTHAPADARPHRKSDRVEKWIRGVVLFVIAFVPVLAFAFSFGNVGLRGVSLGVDPRIAFLTGPALDLSVTGLIVAATYLSYLGWSDRDLWPVHLMSALCGTAMIALNCGQALQAHQWQRAGFDAVGPLLLIGWGFLGPWLLRQLADARTALEPAAAGPGGTVPGVAAEHPAKVPGTVPHPVAQPGPTVSTEVPVAGSSNPAAPGATSSAGTRAAPAAAEPRSRRAARADAENAAPASLADRAKARDAQKERQLEIVRGLVDDHGPTVTLSTIIAHTGVSKSTASRYRSEIVDGPAPAAPPEPAGADSEPERELESVS